MAFFYTFLSVGNYVVFFMEISNFANFELINENFCHFYHFFEIFERLHVSHDRGAEWFYVKFWNVYFILLKWTIIESEWTEIEYVCTKRHSRARILYPSWRKGATFFFSIAVLVEKSKFEFENCEGWTWWLFFCEGKKLSNSLPPPLHSLS